MSPYYGAGRLARLEREPFYYCTCKDKQVPVELGLRLVTDRQMPLS